MTINITGKGIKCVRCGKVADVNHVIDDRWYGSLFDCVSEPTTIPVCSECDSKFLDRKWFEEKPQIDKNGFEKYKYEESIMHFIASLDEEIAEKVLFGYYR